MLQPRYSFDGAERDRLFSELLDLPDRCDESMDLIVLPEYGDAPVSRDGDRHDPDQRLFIDQKRAAQQSADGFESFLRPAGRVGVEKRREVVAVDVHPDDVVLFYAVVLDPVDLCPLEADPVLAEGQAGGHSSYSGSLN